MKNDWSTTTYFILWAFTSYAEDQSLSVHLAAHTSERRSESLVNEQRCDVVAAPF